MKIIVVGACGRMGRMVIQAAEEAGHVVVGGLERPDHSMCNTYITSHHEKIIPIRSFISDIPEKPDVVIDFSTPDGTATAVKECETHSIPLVTGTTGLGEDVFRLIEALSQKVPVVQSPNMSPGVNMLFAVAKIIASALGPEFDIEIAEIHHRNKVDAPSGTALKLLDVLAQARGMTVQSSGMFGRSGRTGPRPQNQIGVMALRGGDVVGDHTVYFLGPDERLEITHRAHSRMVFARGAVKGAEWVQGREPGIYSMVDVLGISIHGDTR